MQTHHAMLTDEVRMETFRIAMDVAVREGDVVLDAGCGTGILSFLALKAGAAKVYAVERSKSIRIARRLARENGMEDRIIFVNEDVLSADIPEKVDGVVCELLGFIGLGENIISIMDHVRANFIKPDAWLMPVSMKTMVAPICDPLLYDETFMSHAGLGIKMETMRDELANDFRVVNISETSLMSKPGAVKKVDFAMPADAAAPGGCKLTLTRRGPIHGLGAWFTAELAPGVSLDTRPGPPFTHWRQAYLPFRRPMPAEKGDVLAVTLESTDMEKNEIFTWGAELRDGGPDGAVKDTRHQSGALTYHYIADE